MCATAFQLTSDFGSNTIVKHDRHKGKSRGVHVDKPGTGAMGPCCCHLSTATPGGGMTGARPIPLPGAPMPAWPRPPPGTLVGPSKPPPCSSTDRRSANTARTHKIWRFTVYKHIFRVRAGYGTWDISSEACSHCIFGDVCLRRALTQPNMK